MQSDKTLTLSAEGVPGATSRRAAEDDGHVGRDGHRQMARAPRGDDYDKMSSATRAWKVFEWSSSKKGEERRGATGGGDGVQ